MDWPLIGILAISAGSLVTYFVMGRSEVPKARGDRKIQGLEVVKSNPPRPADTEAARRFIEAMKADS